MSVRQMSPHRNRVLIVSADSDLNLLLNFLLEVDGFQVSVSTTPGTAIESLFTDQPEAIFFDLGFQGVNNLFFLHSIQQACPDTPLYTIVRRELHRLAEKSLRAGARGYLLTPVDYRDVKQLLGGTSRGRTQAAAEAHRNTTPSEGR